MSRRTGWTCQRRQLGVACRQHNPARKRNCLKCGKPRPPRRGPAHLRALDSDYAEFVKLNGGEFCAICGRPPSSVRRLDRDHDHKTGKPRGLLCARCNRALPSWITAEWLTKALTYIERTSHGG